VAADGHGEAAVYTGKASQTVTFTSTPPAHAVVGGATYRVTATGGSSGNPVTFALDPASEGCMLTGAVVSFSGTGICVIDADQAGSSSFSAAPQVQQSIVVGTAPGYVLSSADGGIFSFGPPFHGSTGSLTLNQPVVGLASTKDGQGYWTVARDGTVVSFGDASFHGYLPGLVATSNIVGMAADTATGGYWLVGSNGGVYAFGAPFRGSIPGLGQHVSDIVGIASTSEGGGYYLVGSNGSVYAFGDARYQGGANTLARINAPIVGLTVDSATGGYWLAGSDGGVYAYDAPFRGSAGGTTLNKAVVGISATTDGSGYYLAASDGGVFSYNAPFLGSMGDKHLSAPMVGIAAAG
jgi:hypothetical protein